MAAGDAVETVGVAGTAERDCCEGVETAAADTVERSPSESAGTVDGTECCERDCCDAAESGSAVEQGVNSDKRTSVERILIWVIAFIENGCARVCDGV